MKVSLHSAVMPKYAIHHQGSRENSPSRHKLRASGLVQSILLILIVKIVLQHNLPKAVVLLAEVSPIWQNILVVIAHPNSKLGDLGRSEFTPYFVGSR
jgi:hypothetical protein